MDILEVQLVVTMVLLQKNPHLFAHTPICKLTNLVMLSQEPILDLCLCLCLPVCVCLSGYHGLDAFLVHLETLGPFIRP